jgi:tight adherence protein C
VSALELGSEFAQPGGMALALLVLSGAVVGGTVGVIVASVVPLVPSLSGRVAARRTEMGRGGWLGGFLDRALQWLAGGLWSVPGLRGQASKCLAWPRKHLNLAGNPWAISAEEFPLVVVCLSTLGGALGWALGLGVNLTLALGFMGCVALPVRVLSLAGDRRRQAGREMPRHMDMLALCMSSGMDLVAALRQVSAGDRGVLAEEITYLLRTLEMGQTRREALLMLEESLPSPEVGDFCRAVIQAEAKGASVRDALVQQAVMSRAKRSVRAEELAARAAVLLLGPMLMLVVCVLLLIIGPLLVGGVGL